MTLHGDFSSWDQKREKNISAVLHQQGRIILDPDLNDQALITLGWQDTAGKDIIGAGVAAVRSGEPDALKVTSVDSPATDGSVEVTIQGGRAWVDGIQVTVAGDKYKAGFLELPFQDVPSPPPGTVGTRDAIILEVWRESVSAFQAKETWLEPALGGPDTTERIVTAKAFRLLRLDDTLDCPDIYGKVADDFPKKGGLRVRLQKPSSGTTECPVTDTGGYAGIEHFLYRIEIAETGDSSAAFFKWSRFNGGLVGRGEFKIKDSNVVATIHDNLQAIINSELTTFYLEAIEFDEETGRYEVVYSAEFTLNSENNLESPVASKIYGDIPGTGDTFFRLWDGIQPVSDFTANERELVDGIYIQFNYNDPAVHSAGDYWTFPVRAATANPEYLVGSSSGFASPYGIHFHRVPLAIIKWGENNTLASITDCRIHFRPLIDRNICCTYSVGDGRTSFGDYNSLQEAIVNLPPKGGEIYLLPGEHAASVIISGKTNIRIRGCGIESVIKPAIGHTNWIFSIEDSSIVSIENLTMINLAGGAVKINATTDTSSKEITIKNNRIVALTYAIGTPETTGSIRDLVLCNNRIEMLDRVGGYQAIAVLADTCLIERNILTILSAPTTPEEEEPPGGGSVYDPCSDPEDSYDNWSDTVSADVGSAYGSTAYPGESIVYAGKIYKAVGGILVAGGSERIVITENIIIGGAGNGITLGGSISAVNRTVAMKTASNETVAKPRDTLAAAAGKVADAFGQVFGTHRERATESSQGKTTDAEDKSIEKEAPSAMPFVHDVLIERNKIAGMGLSGICGFDLYGKAEFSKKPDELIREPIEYAVLNTIVFGLGIDKNRIRDCLQHPPDNVTVKNTLKNLGIGGIALGLCSDLSITRNTITGNGSLQQGHVCGIYVYFGNGTTITGNTITGNGYSGKVERSDIGVGISGGIVLGTASAFTDFDNLYRTESITAPNTPMTHETSTTSDTALAMPGIMPPSGKNAAVVHENTVDQPAGNALVIFAYGPVSVTHNYFCSRLVNGGGLWSLLGNLPSLTPFSVIENIFGTVFVLNIGGFFNLPSVIQSLEELYGYKPTQKAASGSPGMILTLPSLLSYLYYSLDSPSGDTIYSTNQVYLGTKNSALISQFIGSTGDISYIDNQSKCTNSDSNVLINTALLGLSQRAVNNRFKEVDTPVDGKIQPRMFLSLLSLSYLMNHTTENQADHCIFAMNSMQHLSFIDRNSLLIPTIAALTNEKYKRINFCQEVYTLFFWGIVDIYSKITQPPPEEPAASEETPAAGPEESIQSTISRYREPMIKAATSAYDTVIAERMKAVERMMDLCSIQEAVVMDRYGPDSVKADRAKTMVTRSSKVLDKVIAHEQISRMSVPEVKEEEALVHGRVDDAVGLGYAGLEVRIENANGDTVSTTKTDDSGYYSFVMDNESTASLARESPKGVTISVYDKEGNRLSSRQATVAAGNVAMTDLRLKEETAATLKRTAAGPDRRRPIG